MWPNGSPPLTPHRRREKRGEGNALDPAVSGEEAARVREGEEREAPVFAMAQFPFRKGNLRTRRIPGNMGRASCVFGHTRNQGRPVVAEPLFGKEIRLLKGGGGKEGRDSKKMFSLALASVRPSISSRYFCSTSVSKKAKFSLFFGFRAGRRRASRQTIGSGAVVTLLLIFGIILRKFF